MAMRLGLVVEQLRHNCIQRRQVHPFDGRIHRGYGKKAGVGFPYILRKNNKGVFDKRGKMVYIDNEMSSDFT
jgi:hypothetical protein